MDGRTRRREDTRQRLFEAAVELIAEQGFSATTVDDIALRAEVAKGTVYYNFASKTALFEELLRHGIGLLTDEFRAAVAGLPPREAVAALVRAQLEYIRRYRAFAQLLLSEMWRTNREWQQTLVLLREQAIGVIAETVQAGVDSGDLPADLDVRVAVVGAVRRGPGGGGRLAGVPAGADHRGRRAVAAGDRPPGRLS